MLLEILLIEYYLTLDALKYSERLNAKIFEYDREIEEVANTRMAKFYHAVSDIAVYGGNKFVERQSQGFIKGTKKELSQISEFIGSKLMDTHARITGKDWTFAQIYRFKCKIKDCAKQN